MEESLGQTQRFDKVTQLLYGIRSFVLESIKSIIDLIFEAFEVLENTHRVGIKIRNFGDILSIDLEHGQDFIVGLLSTFIANMESLIEEVRRRKGLPNVKIHSQIQARWKGHVDILKELKEKATLLEDKKRTIFFKVFDVVNEIEGPCLTKDSMLLLHDELEVELSKLTTSGLKYLTS